VGRRFAALMLVLASACSTTLEQALAERDADEVIVALEAHGIGATREPSRGASGFDVVVLEGDVGRALTILRDEGLPREDPDPSELYDEPMLVPTAGEERARAAHRTATELARTIETLDGVRSARVLIGVPDPSVVPVDDAAPDVTASVLVRSASDASVDEAAIRTLVAASVSGLTPEHVVIVVRPAAPRAPIAALDHVGPFAVTAGSGTGLRFVIGALLVVNVALAIASLMLVRRRAR
jgi:type III secretion protein J